MYKYEIDGDIQAGKKVRRLGWPKEQYLQKNPLSHGLELDESELSSLGLDADARVTVNEDTLVLVQSPKKAVLGYAFSPEDMSAQDWEVVA